jgi:hypothetical protein
LQHRDLAAIGRDWRIASRANRLGNNLYSRRYCLFMRRSPAADFIGAIKQTKL